MTLRAVVIAVALLLALAVPTAAVTTNEDDAGAITMAPHDGPNGQYATVSDGELEIAFEDLNDDAVTTASDVFTVTAEEGCTSVWVTLEDATVYHGGDPADRIDSEADAVLLQPGETASVGFQFDTRTSVPDADALTVHANESDDCDDSSGGGGGGGSGSGGVSRTPTEPTPNETIPNETTPTDGKPEFAVSLSVAETDDPAERTVTVTVENVGDAGGTHVVDLTVDGTVVATQSVTVPAGERRQVAFTHRFGGAGQYVVGVGDQQRTVTVERGAADLAVTDVDVDERRLNPGDAATITATVENSGATDGEMTVGLAVARAVVDSTTVSVPAGETLTVSFEWTFDTPGVYPVAAGGVGGGDVVVEAGDTTSNRLLASSLGTALLLPLLVGLLLSVWRRQQLVALGKLR